MVGRGVGRCDKSKGIENKDRYAELRNALSAMKGCSVIVACERETG